MATNNTTISFSGSWAGIPTLLEGLKEGFGVDLTAVSPKLQKIKLASEVTVPLKMPLSDGSEVDLVLDLKP